PTRFRAVCGASRNRTAPRGEVCSAHFAVVIEYKDQEQTTELRLPQDIIATLALEAEFRDMRIGELIGALTAATMEKGLLQLILDTEKGTKSRQTMDLREMRISPNKCKHPISVFQLHAPTARMRKGRAWFPDLARSLNNLGVDLSNLGRREEALAATQEGRRHLSAPRGKPTGRLPPRSRG